MKRLLAYNCLFRTREIICRSEVCASRTSRKKKDSKGLHPLLKGAAPNNIPPPSSYGGL